MALKIDAPGQGLKEIAPPVDFFPYPLWMVAAAGALLALILFFLGRAIIRWWKNRPVAMPPDPRAEALAKLEAARMQVERLAPYAFSILVSDILRTYASDKYKLPATRQTSPEFLAAAAASPYFSPAEKSLLGEFLGGCDLIKFSQVDAGNMESKRLLEEAIRFVKGGDA